MLLAAVGILRASAYSFLPADVSSVSKLGRYGSPLLSIRPSGSGPKLGPRSLGLRGGTQGLFMAAAAAGIKTEKLTPQTAGVFHVM